MNLISRALLLLPDAALAGACWLLQEFVVFLCPKLLSLPLSSATSCMIVILHVISFSSVVFCCLALGGLLLLVGVI
jgi:hypothetical protein